MYSYAQSINNMVDRLQYLYPFKNFYSNIHYENKNNFSIYHIKYENNDVYKIDNNYTYTEYQDIPNPKYSTPNIPVFTRLRNELEYMITDNYYKFFNHGNIKSTINNPTSVYSEYYNNYVITPTVTPACDTDLVQMNQYYTAFDFYTNVELIKEMYESFKALSEMFP